MAWQRLAVDDDLTRPSTSTVTPLRLPSAMMPKAVAKEKKQQSETKCLTIDMMLTGSDVETDGTICESWPKHVPPEGIKEGTGGPGGYVERGKGGQARPGKWELV